MKPVHIIGVPMDLGVQRRGVDMGPSAIRYAGLEAELSKLSCGLSDMGDVFVPAKEALGSFNSAKYLEAICNVCEQTAEAGAQALSNGQMPVFLGGDHSMAVGTVAGVTRESQCGVLWVDAHGDFNIPETSPNGNVHGMPLSILMGTGITELVDVDRPGAKLKAEDVVIFGARDFDYDERDMLIESGVKIITMREIDENGIAKSIHHALEILSNNPEIHVSFDMDVLDPQEAPGVGTKAPGGLSYREAHLVMEMLFESGRVRSADIAEVNPICDEANRTAEMAVGLLASLLGKVVL